MPKPEGSLSAVVVSGGKQYRVAPGDRILVDRLAAEPGASIKLGKVLMVRDGTEYKVGAPAVDGVDVDAKVLAHSRGPRIETLRYKSKKRVRVHRGGRADYTALEILAVGGLTVATGTEAAKTEESGKKKGGGTRRRAKAVEAVEEPKIEAKSDSKAEAPKRAPRKAKKE